MDSSIIIQEFSKSIKYLKLQFKKLLKQEQKELVNRLISNYSLMSNHSERKCHYILTTIVTCDLSKMKIPEYIIT